MKSEGYVFTDEKRLICKPDKQNIKYGCSFSRLGRGYKYSELKWRVTSKYAMFAGADPSEYTDEQKRVYIYYRDIMRIYYRELALTDEIVKEMRENSELLFYIHKNNIHSTKELEDHVNKLGKEAFQKTKEKMNFGSMIIGYISLKRNVKNCIAARPRLRRCTEDI